MASKSETTLTQKSKTIMRRIVVVVVVVVAITSLGIATSCSNGCWKTSSSLLGPGILSVEALSVPSFTSLSKPSLSPNAADRRRRSSWISTRRNLPSGVDYHRSQNGSSAFVLFLAQQTPPQPRMPRRMLKKRVQADKRGKSRNRRNNRHADFPRAASIGTIVPGVISKGTSIRNNNNRNAAGERSQSSTIAADTPRGVSRTEEEYRPLVPSIRRDRGEDYWIDPEDLKKERLRKEELERQRIAFENRSGDEAMPQEKLMTEVKAPYRQNWIGYFSLVVAVLSIIVAQFPELLEPAAITRFPDL